MSGDIIAGLALAREMLECDRDALVECGTCPLDGLPPDDQIIANSYTSAMKAVDAAAFELGRLTAERDALIDGLRDEIEENLRLRDLGGARPDEGITAMTERVIRERDALAARLAEIERAEPPSDHPEDDLEIGPVRQPSICTSAGNIGTGDLCTAYSETTGRCSHPADCDYQQSPERPLGAKIAPLTDEQIDALPDAAFDLIADMPDGGSGAGTWERLFARTIECAHGRRWIRIGEAMRSATRMHG